MDPQGGIEALARPPFRPVGPFRAIGAMAVTPDGSTIVGSVGVNNAVQAFRWTPDRGIDLLGTYFGGSTNANALAADASSIAGVALLDAPVGLRWTADAGWMPLGTLDGGAVWAATADDMAPDGAIIVGGRGAGRADTASLWREELGVTRLSALLATGYGLNLEGWTLVNARGISDDGRVIVGMRINPLGQPQASAVVLPFRPIASPATPGVLAFAGAIVRRRRR